MSVYLVWYMILRILLIGFGIVIGGLCVEELWERVVVVVVVIFCVDVEWGDVGEWILFFKMFKVVFFV